MKSKSKKKRILAWGRKFRPYMRKRKNQFWNNNNKSWRKR